jgi:uncharacterized protein with NRDE domain
MTYTVYNLMTGRRHKAYNTIRAAKGVATRLTNKDKDGYEYMAMETGLYNEIYNKLVPVKNLLSGKEVMIRQQDMGTCVDPSTETYWSM